MDCPYCFGSTRVVDSRPEEDSVDRRRKCKECGKTFHTLEIDLDTYRRLVKGSASNG